MIADMIEPDMRNEPESREHRDFLLRIAKIIVEEPERVEDCRETLKYSARMMISNQPEAVSAFQKLVEEVDSFIHACRSGEIDPKAFIEKNQGK